MELTVERRAAWGRAENWKGKRAAERLLERVTDNDSDLSLFSRGRPVILEKLADALERFNYGCSRGERVSESAKRRRMRLIERIGPRYRRRKRKRRKIL